MAKYRYVYTVFWDDPDVMENFTPEDKLFYLYLLTNPRTTQIGVYKITKKEMAFGLGYSIESINSLICRFVEHHKLIKYDEVTRELAIKNWGKYNLNKGGKPIIDCITKEFKEVQNIELVKYVAESIRNESIKNIYYSFIKNSVKNLKSHDTLDETRCDTYNDTSAEREEGKNKITFLGKPFNNAGFDDTYHDTSTISGQKENKKQKEKQKENNNTTSKKDTNLSNKGLNDSYIKTDGVEADNDKDIFVKILDYYKLKACITMEKPVDVVLARQFQEEKIPLHVIKDGINLAFETFKPKYKGDKIRSLKFCEGFIRDLAASERAKEKTLNNNSMSESEIRSITAMLKNKVSDMEIPKIIVCLSESSTVSMNRLEYLKEKIDIVESYAKGKNISYTGALIKAIKENWSNIKYSVKDKFNNYDQRKYDFKDLEHKLLKAQGFYD
ncbi:MULTISPECIES: hypothetical protein [Clostridium]|uniref:hypothetical protein n=1 Tax=Clostridium TaxID=1485 RepID=UPI000825A5A2|nr:MULTISPECIES: hypothetical protein [Clostridium]